MHENECILRCMAMYVELKPIFFLLAPSAIDINIDI